uniref:Uncharacterized protein n=1 Tax=Ficedula albicollis TaxID=59894 RepID=A0A803VFW9_FICAL
SEVQGDESLLYLLECHTKKKILLVFSTKYIGQGEKIWCFHTTCSALFHIIPLPALGKQKGADPQLCSGQLSLPSWESIAQQPLTPVRQE